MKKHGFQYITNMLLLLILFHNVLNAQKPYRGAEVYSKEQVQYGRFTISMKMVDGSGMLSTFFTMKGNSNDPGVLWEEIDIEVMGKENATIMGTNIITGGLNGSLNHHGQDIGTGLLLADEYHTYTLEWTPEYVAWFINGTEYRRETGGVIKDLLSPHTYRFNAWISCSQPWAGSIDVSKLPQHQYIDWIEYYSYDLGVFNFEWRDDFDTFDWQRWSKAQWTFECNEVIFVPQNANIVDGKLVLSITDPSVSTRYPNYNQKTGLTITHNDELNFLEITTETDGQKEVRIFDLQGRVVASTQFSGTHLIFQCNHIKPGVYLLNVQSDQISHRLKIMTKR